MLTQLLLLAAACPGALVGARYGSSWLPVEWLTQLEQDAPGITFFNMPAVQARLHCSVAGPTPTPAEGHCFHDDAMDIDGGDGHAEQQQQQQGGRGWRMQEAWLCTPRSTWASKVPHCWRS